MRKVGMSIIVMFLITNAFGQDYQIQDFKPDSLTTWQLRGYGTFSTTKQKQENTYNEDVFDKESNLQIRPQLSYNYIKLRRYFETRYHISTYLRYSTANDEESSDFERDTKIQSYRVIGDFYHTKYLDDKIGIIGDISTFLNYDKMRQETQNEVNPVHYFTENTQSYPHFSLSFQPGVSYGRIYNGQYSAKAMEILEELRKAGELNRELTKNEYIEFSQIVLEEMAEYHYDNRIKKIEALERILGFLQGRGVITDTKVNPVLITEDIYSYNLMGDFIERQFGYRFYGKVLATYSKADGEGTQFIKSFDTDTGTETITKDQKYGYDGKDMEYGLTAGINYGNIFNWNFFYNLDFNITYDKANRVDETKVHDKLIGIKDNTESESDYSYFESLLQADIYYQFDSRSFFKLANRVYYTKYGSESKNIDDEQATESYGIDIDPHYIYFITPKFVLDANAFLDYRKRWERRDLGTIDKSGRKQFRLGVGLDLNYYF
ncbi:MAG: hypothetical protein ACLFQM_02185 [Fidelibacterota bacterium]